MAFLNILSQAVAPTGFWSWLILNVFSFIGNYGWRIILFTVCLKLVLSPLDIFQRYQARKNQLITLKIRPQMEKLQKMYGDDQQLLAKKQMELNKKAGVKYFSSCLPAIVTLVVFITLLYYGLQPISQYQNFRQYEQLYAKYTEFCNDELVEERYEELYPEMYDDSLAAAEAKRTEIRAAQVEALKEEIGQKAYDDVMAQKTDDMSEQEIKALEERAAEAKAAALSAFIPEEHTDEIESRTDKAVVETAEASLREEALSQLREIAQTEVFNEYDNNVKVSFLWVKNIWNADVFWTAPINSASQFKSNIGAYGTDYKKAGVESADELAKMLSEYDNVMAKLLNDPEYNRTNGYMILPILTILMSVAMQIISFRQQKESGQMNAQAESTSKIMMFVMPVMMAYFSFSYTAAFALYLVMNYIVSLVIALLSTLVIKIADKKAQLQMETAVQSYGRPDFSDRKTAAAEKDDRSAVQKHGRPDFSDRKPPETDTKKKNNSKKE